MNSVGQDHKHESAKDKRANEPSDAEKLSESAHSDDEKELKKKLKKAARRRVASAIPKLVEEEEIQKLGTDKEDFVKKRIKKATKYDDAFATSKESLKYESSSEEQSAATDDKQDTEDNQKKRRKSKKSLKPIQRQEEEERPSDQDFQDHRRATHKQKSKKSRHQGKFLLFYSFMF